MKTFPILLLCACLSSLSPAQVLPGWWHVDYQYQGHVWDCQGATLTTFNHLPFGGYSVRVARHQTGLVLLGGTSAIAPYRLSGQVGPLFWHTSRGAFAVHSSGGVVMTIDTPSGLGVRLVDTTDTVVWEIELPGRLSQAYDREFITTDRNGNTWVLEKRQQLWVISPSGVPQSVALAGSPNSMQGLQVDAAGTAWILSETTSTAPKLQRYASDGTLLLEVAMNPNAAWLDIDLCGRPQVLYDGWPGAGTAIEIRRPDTGALIERQFPNVTLPFGPYFALDSKGNRWFPGGRLAIVDHRGVFQHLTGLSNGSTPDVHLGDPLGMKLVRAIDPAGDADLDGVSNEDEGRYGTDPLDPSSRPSQLTLVTPPSPGGVLSLSGTEPSALGAPYLFGASLGSSGIRYESGGRCITVPLSPDPTLAWWLSPTNTLAIQGFFGPSNTAQLSIPLPPQTLESVPITFALVTFEPGTTNVSRTSLPLEVILP